MCFLHDPKSSQGDSEGDHHSDELKCIRHNFLAQIWIFVVPDLKLRSLAGRTAQQGKVLAAKPDSLSSVPGTHMGGGENRLMHVVL